MTLEVVVGRTGVGVKDSGVAVATTLAILDCTVGTTMGVKDSRVAVATTLAISTGTVGTTVGVKDSGVTAATVLAILDCTVGTTVVSILGSEFPSQATNSVSVVVKRSRDKDLYSTTSESFFLIMNRVKCLLLTYGSRSRMVVFRKGRTHTLDKE